MGLTYRETAIILDLCMASVGYYTVGIRKKKDGDTTKSVEVPKTILLACSAVENKLPPIQ